MQSLFHIERCFFRNILNYIFCFLFLLLGCQKSTPESEVRIMDDLGKLRYVMNYNRKLLVQMSCFGENGGMKRQTFRSPTSGLITEERLFRQSGALENVTIYRYFPDGKLKEKEVHSEKGDLQFSFSYEYDGNGTLSKTESYDAAEKKKSVVVYEVAEKAANQSVFSEDGKLLSVYKESPDMMEFSEYSNERLRQTVTYNKKDNNCEERIFDNTGHLISWKKIAANGLLKEEALYEHGLLAQRNVYRYNRQGKQIEKLEYIGEAGKLERQFIYSYDRYGNRIKMDVYDAQGKILEYLK